MEPFAAAVAAIITAGGTLIPTERMQHLGFPAMNGDCTQLSALVAPPTMPMDPLPNSGRTYASAARVTITRWG